MNEEKLAEATEYLAEQQEKFVVVSRMMVASSNALTELLNHNRKFFEAYRVAFEDTSQIMTKQIDMLREIAAGIQALIKANADTNATVSENSELTKALLAKVDSYFGTTSGLDYDN